MSRSLAFDVVAVNSVATPHYVLRLSQRKPQRIPQRIPLRMPPLAVGRVRAML
jgi:hypothetical protein